MKFQLGRKEVLWYVPKYRGISREVTVLKVGRKWAGIDLLDGDSFHRIDIVTLIVGGKYSSPGQCYLSKEVYETKVLVDKAWDALKKNIPYWASENITLEDILKAKDLLGLKYE